MEFRDLIIKRRSVRNYEEAVIDHKKIEEILKKAQLAPSWKNSQTARCYVIEPGDKLDQIRQALPSFNQKSSANAALIVTTFAQDLSGSTK